MKRSAIGFIALYVAIGSMFDGACVRAELIKNISTGFNNGTGLLLPNGAFDTDYVMGAGGTGGHIGENPLVRVTPIPSPWIADNASNASRWLVLPGDGIEGIDVPIGSYFFETSVNLTGFNPATAQITGLNYAADNKLIALRINGTAVFSQDQSFAEEFETFHPLGNLGLGLFHSGSNTIRFEVINDLLGPSPIGLRVEGSVEGTAIPEPSSLCLGGLAVTIWSFRRWRTSLWRTAPNGY